VLYLQLMKSTLLLPTPKPLELPPDGSKLKDLQLVTQPGRAGETIWLAFTSRQALHLWREQFPDAYVAIQGSQVFALAVQNNVDQLVINPAGPVGGYVTRIELQMLAEGTIPMEGGEKVNTVLARANTHLQIGPVAQGLAPGLLDHFKGHLEKEARVEAAYLASVMLGGGLPHLLLGICFKKLPDEKSIQGLMAEIGKDVGKYLGKGEFVDMVPLDEGHEWYDYLQEKGTQVYRRG
jgi:hypothetical protein